MSSHASLTIAFFFSGLIMYALPLAQVDPAIWKTLESKPSTDILVTFKPTNDDIISKFAKSGNSRHASSLNELNKELKDRTKKAQSQVTQYVDQQRSSRSNHPTPVSLWLPNILIIRQADAEWIKKISTFEEVSEVIEDKRFPRMMPVPIDKSEEDRRRPSPKPLWHLSATNVLDVWATGNRGKGVVIGMIDSGVRLTHEALKNSFRSSYGWYDPINKTSGPTDDAGHGTQVLGVMVGKSPKETIGVAPDAKWIACKDNLDDLNVAMSSLAQCLQWMWCPTDTQGNNENCDMAPKVINNSWYWRALYSVAETTLLALSAREIAVIFAAGNSGPQCMTIFYPPESEYVITVGSTDEKGQLSSFSSRGPGERRKQVKPDFVAPGEPIYTADILSDTAYHITGGTSYAAPFVSGLAALFYSAYPKASLEQFKTALRKGVVTVKASGRHCGGADGKSNLFGYGGVNALKFMNAAEEMRKMTVARGARGNYESFHKLFLLSSISISIAVLYI